MKPTAYIINIGRGKLIDEAAMVRALKDKGIAGAGLAEVRELTIEDKQNTLLRQLRSKYDTLSIDQILEIQASLGHQQGEVNPCKACKIISQKEYRLAED